MSPPEFNGSKVEEGADQELLDEVHNISCYGSDIERKGRVYGLSTKRGSSNMPHAMEKWEEWGLGPHLHAQISKNDFIS